MLRRHTTALFVITQRIGDCLTITPAIDAAVDHFERVIVVCKPEAKTIFMNHPRLYRVYALRTGWVRCVAMFGWLIPRQVDVAFCYTENRTFLKLATQLAIRCFGFRSSQLPSHQSMRLIELPSVTETHLIDQNLLLVQADGVPVSSKKMRFDLLPAVEDSAQRFLTKLRHRWVTIISVKIQSHPDRPYRDWPLECFDQCFQSIEARHPGVCFILLGTPSESLVIANLVEGRSNRIACTDQPLVGAAGLIKYSDLYIGVDTGTTQMACCFDVPIIGLYHCAIGKQRAGPLTSTCDFSLEMPERGLACLRTVGSMRSITVEEVVAAIESALQYRLSKESCVQ